MPQLDFITYINQYASIILAISLVLILMSSVLLSPIKRNIASRVSSDQSFKVNRELNFCAFKKLVSK